MRFALNDLYPENGATMTTTEQTIPTRTEENYAIDNQVADGGSGMTIATSKGTSSKIWGSILLLVGLMVILHFID